MSNKSIAVLLLISIVESLVLIAKTVRKTFQSKPREWAIMLTIMAIFAAIVFVIGFLAHAVISDRAKTSHLLAQINPAPKAGEDAPRPKFGDVSK